MPAKKGMVTTYDEQTVDKARRQTDEVSEDIPSLEELQARALAQAKEDYERLLARKAEIEQLKKEAFKRKMRIGQLRKKLDGLKEELRSVFLIDIDFSKIIGLITALELFERTDHEAQWRVWREQSRVIVDALQEIPGLTVCLEDEDPNRQGPQAVIYFERSWDGPSPAEVQERLRRGDPPIYIGRGGYRGELWVTPVNLQEGEEEIVARRLKEILTAC